ncbi:MAG TPA: glycosyltransferase family 39 protein [Thermomicrobiales bacterium]|nr:glycosyltransferase family 39 protein [Thermomicrobiales bacterium]
MTGPALVKAPPRAARRRRRGSRFGAGALAWLGTPRGEALLVVLLFAGAVAARWPYLLRLPHFTDEIGETRWALRIYTGQAFPLVAQVPYAGPLWHYIEAACLVVFGPHMILPRLLVMTFGALTVVLTYFLGRELAGRGIAFLGAALLATSPQHIVVNSHVAWENSTTPFFATLGLWLLVLALGGAGPRGFAMRAGWLLVASGFVYGLVVQTHFGTVVLAPAIAATTLVALARRRAWRAFGQPWPYLALVAAPIGYAPVLIYNVMHGFKGYWRMQGRNYAFEQHPSAASYLHNLQNLAFEVARMVSNPFRIPARRLDYLTSPYMLAAVLLCGLGLLLLARRGRALPLAVFAATFALLPRFNHAYGVEGDRYLVTGRYVAYLLPLAYLASAAAVWWLGGLLLRRVPRFWRDAAVAVPLVLAGFMVLYPLQPLERYYTHEAALDPDNATFLATVQLVNQLRGPRTPVWIDGFLYKVDLKDGVDARDVLDTLFTLDGIPHRVVDDPGAELQRLGPTLDPHDTEALPLVVMMRDRCFPIRDTVPLQRVSGRLLLRELYWTKLSYYGVYRYAPPPAPAGCFAPTGPVPGD